MTSDPRPSVPLRTPDGRWTVEEAQAVCNAAEMLADELQLWMWSDAEPPPLLFGYNLHLGRAEHAAIRLLCKALSPERVS